MIDMGKAKNVLEGLKGRAAKAVGVDQGKAYNAGVVVEASAPESCQQALREAGVAAERLVAYFVLQLPVASANAPPQSVHIALTEGGLAVIRGRQDGGLDVDHAQFEELYWSVKKFGNWEDRCTLNVRLPKEDYTYTVARGEVLDAFKRKVCETLFSRAQANLAERRCFYAETLLKQIDEEDERAEEARKLLEEVRWIAQAAVVYDGGHWQHPEPAAGVLRLDDDGVEFSPTVPGSTGYFRIPFERILDVSRPQPGQPPNELLRNSMVQRSATMAITAAAGVAASLVVGPGGFLLGRGLAALLGKDDQRRQPLNRVVVAVAHNGLQYPLFFNTVADSLEQIELDAKLFANHAVTVRHRWIRPPGASAPPEPRIVGCPKCDTKLRVGEAGVVLCPNCSTKLRVS